MHERTKQDLAQIEICKQQISVAEDNIRNIKEGCQHFDYAARYEETFAWEFEPKNICVVCGNRVVDVPVSYEEKLKLLKEWYCDIEVPLTEDQIKTDINGFNL